MNFKPVFICLILMLNVSAWADSPKDIRMDEAYSELEQCMKDSVPSQCLNLAESFKSEYAGIKGSDDYFFQVAEMIYKRAGVDACIDFSLPLLEVLKDDRSYVQIHEKIGFCYTLKDNFDSSDLLFERARSRAVRAGLEELELEVLNRIAGNWRAKGDYDKAQKIYLDVVERSKLIGADYTRAVALNGLGRLFGMIALEEKSVRYFEQASEAFYQSEDTIAALVAGINQANSLISLNKLEEAEAILLRASKILESRPDVYVHIGCLGQLARVQDMREEYPSAVKSYQKTISLAEKAGITSQQAYYQNKLAQTLTKSGQFELAEETAFKALKIYGNSGSIDEKRQVYLSLFKLYEKQRQFEKAYEFRILFEEMTDSVMSARQKEEVLTIEENYKQSLSDKELQIAEQKSEKRKITLISMSAFMVVFLVLGGTVINRQRLKNRATRELAEEREKKLQLELDQKKRELVGKALIISEKNELLDQLQQSLNGKTDHGPEEIREVLQDIQLSTVQGKDWKSFLDTFEQLHPNFLTTIDRTHSALTENDLRMCALIYLRFSNKEIAAIQHISDDGVKKARYRLKKKLGLDKDDTLAEYLSKTIFEPHNNH